MNRRDVLLASAASLLARTPALAVSGNVPAVTTALAAPQPVAQVRTSGPDELLAVSTTGTLWQLRPRNAAWTRLADDIDPASPIATGHGRIAARNVHGGLWVGVNGRATNSPEARLAPHAGLCVLPFGIIGVTDVAGHAYVKRFEPDREERWRESARGTESVLPDARPLQVDLDSGQSDDNGQIVVLAGPDGTRYTHGALGDTIECTRVLYLERHGLQVLRSLTLPPPYVLEDIAPRPIAWRGGRGLLTMRSGPQGSQLAVIAASRSRGDMLEIAALGAPIGTSHRWMAASTDGNRLVAVHTPHIGGVLHAYRWEPDGTLAASAMQRDIRNHRLGSRELDLSVWLGRAFVAPSQDGSRLRVFDPQARWSEVAEAPMPAAVVATAALANGNAVAALLEDGRIAFTGP